MYKKHKLFNYRFLIHTFFIIFCLTFVLSFLLVVSVSFSDENDLNKHGYQLIPKTFSLEAYKYVFSNPKQIQDAYQVTIFQAFTGAFLNVFVMSLCAYPLSRQSFKYKNPITFYIFFTMLFGGGLIPNYILNTQYLKLGNSIWVYIFPSLANAFHIIILRTFFQGLPSSLVESAKIDGASEIRIFFRIIVPLSKPVLATIALFNLLGRWNDWMSSLLYIKDPELYTLQYLLQRILNEAAFLKQIAAQMPIVFDDMEVLTESMRFAMCVVAAGPMLIVFPFFRKYFTRGLTIGAVKG